MGQPSIVAEALPTVLDRVERRARQDPRCVFNNLGHILDLDLLRASFESLDGKKAIGLDGVRKEEYGRRLEENLKSLSQRLRQGSYHPRPMRIREIPKADGSKRPLAISCFEDKIVQEAVRRILERIFEPRFLDCSFGFRPSRNAHQALAVLDRHLMDRRRCRALLDLDLRKCFNTIPHAPLMKALKSRISDRRFLRLVVKLLRAPTLNAQGVVQRNEVGTPQGSILSPLLANLYLHYAMDRWFAEENRERLYGQGRMVRYADDMVFTFPSMAQAVMFKQLISERLAQCGLAINEAKTQVVPCGRDAAEDHARRGARVPGFVFLGFLHIWGRSWGGNSGGEFWRIKRSTCPKRFRNKLKEVTRYIKHHRHEKDLIHRVKRVVQGYLNYFAVSDNFKRVHQFIRQVVQALYRWLNQRSQRRSYTWDRFQALLDSLSFPKPHLQVNLFALSKALRYGPPPAVLR